MLLTAKQNPVLEGEQWHQERLSFLCAAVLLSDTSLLFASEMGGCCVCLGTLSLTACYLSSSPKPSVFQRSLRCHQEGFVHPLLPEIWEASQEMPQIDCRWDAAVF